ncbi:MAG: hypothetical protein HYV07_12005 [Deltaproteobacteria bacterium]|nr:hypothetical protein [Deltaproteobacteria bacterium]
MLVGGLAAGAYGRPRSTKDVDFLVGNEAFLAAGSVLMHRPGVPFAVGKVPVDTIPLPVDEPWFEEALQPACYSAGIPIVSVEFLVLMKLRAGRLRDQMDIGAVVQEGADLDSVRRLLQQRDPVLLPEFDRIAATAMSESEG